MGQIRTVRFVVFASVVFGGPGLISCNAGNENEDMVNLLKSHSMFSDGPVSYARKALDLTDQTNSYLPTNVQCMVDKGYAQVGAHRGFGIYQLLITEEGKKFVRVSDKKNEFTGRELEPTTAEQIFTIDGIQTNGTSRKVLFTTLLKVAPELSPCMNANRLQPEHFQADLEKFDTGWVINGINRR